MFAASAAINNCIPGPAASKKSDEDRELSMHSADQRQFGCAFDQLQPSVCSEVLHDTYMSLWASSALLSFLISVHGCSGPSQAVDLKYKAVGKEPVVLALYEPWFGMSNHINVGYSSHDPEVVKKQIRKAKEMGIKGFVVDWYGEHGTFENKSYSLVQAQAAKSGFHVAMMYDETDTAEGATDLVIADFTLFHDTYLVETAPGYKAYLRYQGRPVIFVFPHGGHTDWAKIRKLVNAWSPAPLLIQENLPGPHPEAFDGFYPWVQPGSTGWTADGSSWGKDYLSDFYEHMANKYPDYMTVAGVWPQFDDHKASWSLNRHISARCGQTYEDTYNLWRKFFPAGQTIPYILIETWNDYEEGSEVEQGLPGCDG